MSVIKVNNITNRDGTSGPVIAGIVTVSSSSHFVVPTGHTGQRTGLAPDPYEEFLVLALPFNSESVFDDISPANRGTLGIAGISTTASLPFGVTGVTTTSSGIVTFSKYYGSSLFLDGTNDWLNVPGGGDFDFGKNDFTIECWANTRTTSGDGRIINQDRNNLGDGGGTFLFYRYGSTLQFYSAASTAWDNVNALSMGTITVNTWTHLAVTRQNGTVYTWKDGVNIASVVGNLGLTDTGDIKIGTYGDGVGAFWNGYLQDFRIYKGVAKYTSNFTPPNQIAI